MGDAKVNGGLRARLARHIDGVIDGALDRERVVGAIVLVALHGEVIYRRAAGFSDREAQRSMRDDAIFLFASITKPIVSCAALSLLEKGILSLDDSVRKWLPDFEPKLSDGRAPRITVRHLMTHTAGLDYGFQLDGGRYRQAQISNGLDLPGLSMEEQMRRIASVPLLFEPGAAWSYSLATDVLGAILERASGLSLPELVLRNITGPLGMTDSAFVIRDRDRLAIPYADGMPRPVRMGASHTVMTKGGAIRFSPSRLLDAQSYPSGGAGMAGTAADLLGFLEVVRSGGAPILKTESAHALTSNALPEEIAYKSSGWAFGEPGWTFGLGTVVLYDPRITRTPHDIGTFRGGGAYGHYWFVNPTRQLTFIALTNTSFEGAEGAFPVDLVDATYYALSG